MGLINQIIYRLDRPPLCSNCHMRLIQSTSNCVVCGVPLVPGAQPLFPRVFIKWYLTHHQVSCTPTSISEAQLAVKELKAIKRGISNVKRHVMEAKRITRADYTEKIRKPSWLKKDYGRKISRDVSRRTLADNLAPLESEQRSIETLRIQIEQFLLQIEAQLQSL